MEEKYKYVNGKSMKTNEKNILDQYFIYHSDFD